MLQPAVAVPAVTPFDPSDILTADELAARLKVKKTFLYEKMRRAGLPGELPAMRVGKYLRFSWAAVSAWLTTQAVTSHTLRPYSREKGAGKRKAKARKKAVRS